MTNAQVHLEDNFEIVLEEQIEVLGDRAGREFSMGMTAASTRPSESEAKASTESAQCMISALGTILPAASWLKEPGSPWMATFISG